MFSKITFSWEKRVVVKKVIRITIKKFLRLPGLIFFKFFTFLRNFVRLVRIASTSFVVFMWFLPKVFFLFSFCWSDICLIVYPGIPIRIYFWSINFTVIYNPSFTFFIFIIPISSLIFTYQSSKKNCVYKGSGSLRVPPSKNLFYHFPLNLKIHTILNCIIIPWTDFSYRIYLKL